MLHAVEGEGAAGGAQPEEDAIVTDAILAEPGEIAGHVFHGGGESLGVGGQLLDLVENAPCGLRVQAFEIPLEFGRDLDAVCHGFLRKASGLVRRPRWLARAVRILVRKGSSTDSR